MIGSFRVIIHHRSPRQMGRESPWKGPPGPGSNRIVRRNPAIEKAAYRRALGLSIGMPRLGNTRGWKYTPVGLGVLLTTGSRPTRLRTGTTLGTGRRGGRWREGERLRWPSRRASRQRGPSHDWPCVAGPTHRLVHT